MNRLSSLSLCAVLAAASLPLVASAQSARVGAPAPAFSATDSRGQTQSLAQYRGKYVVLEWHNQGCPYTIKHYASGNMQALQKEWTAKGVVWFTVISSARGEQGYVTPGQENAYLAQMHAVPTAVLLDTLGLDRAAFTPTFAVGRVAGWCAHAFEQAATGRLIRPASRYVGVVPS